MELVTPTGKPLRRCRGGGFRIQGSGNVAVRVTNHAPVLCILAPESTLSLTMPACRQAGLCGESLAYGIFTVFTSTINSSIFF
jgi:hypothetical protein